MGQSFSGIAGKQRHRCTMGKRAFRKTAGNGNIVCKAGHCAQKPLRTLGNVCVRHPAPLYRHLRQRSAMGHLLPRLLLT